MLKNMKKNLAILLALGVVVVALGGCAQVGKASTEPQNSLEKIKEAGKIVLGTSADYPPYEFHKEVNGKDEIVGFDIEIAKEIAKDLGVELVIKDMKFEGLLAALEKGNVDFVVAGMVATPERLENADFSKSYYQAEQSFLVKAGKGQDYKSFDDLKGLKVGVQKSTVQEKIAQEKIENPTIKSLSKITDLVLELKNDKIEGVVLVKPVAKAYADANEDLEVAEVSLGKEAGVAIALKKDSPELLAEMNKTLDKLLAENKVNQFINDAIEMVESN